jgi:NAD(P)-dependent dehydrogenase (short-subunit alcohol dehydrogenase family)
VACFKNHLSDHWFVTTTAFGDINNNVISPGVIETPLSAGLSKQLKTILVNTTPLGRMGSPDEIAKAVAFLASDDSSYITGIELSVDEGIAQI